MKFKILLVLTLLSAQSFGCSFAPMMDVFDVNNNENTKSTPEKPNLRVKEIKRGHDDGNFASCSDAGMITLEVLNPQPEVGYVFKLLEGNLEDTIFGSDPVVPSKWSDANTFTFIWLDGSNNEQEPFEIAVEVTAISDAGAVSEPFKLTIAHHGIKAPWWKLW